MYERRQSGDSLYCRYEVQHPQFYIQLVYKPHFEKMIFSVRAVLADQGEIILSISELLFEGDFFNF